METLGKSGGIASAQVNPAREPEIGRPIQRLRENQARTETLLDRLEQVTTRVYGQWPEAGPVGDPSPPRSDNLVGCLEIIADSGENNLARLGSLIDKLSSQV